MKLPQILRRRVPEARQSAATAPYTDAIVAAIIASRDGAALSGIETAAAEIAAGVIGRAFASARIDVPWCGPELRAAIARDLILRGEAVYVLHEGDLIGASTFEIMGGPGRSTWRYRVQLPGPSGRILETFAGAGRVLHARYSVDRSMPWTGIGPLQRAGYAARLAANIEASLRDETSGPVGYLLPIPTDGADASVAALKEDLGALKGRVAVVETTAGGWGEGRTSAPRADYVPQRIGPNPPPSMPQIHSAIQTAVLAACGVPVELVSPADGTGQREAWRRFLHGTVQPLGAIVASEISRLAGREVAFDHEALFASDIAGRARAFQSLVGAGLSIEQAAIQSGLHQPEE